MFIYTLYKTSIWPPINLTQKVYFEQTKSQNPFFRFWDFFFEESIYFDDIETIVTVLLSASFFNISFHRTFMSL